MPTSDPAAALGTDWPVVVNYWCDELDHRAEDSNAVHTAALTLIRPAPGHDHTARTDPRTDDSGAVDDRVRRLVTLDPLRDRPLLDEDADGAVLIDILLAPLSAAITAYTSAAERVRIDDPIWRGAEPLAAVATLLRLGSIYATPECRVRLEGRARYNLAFDAAALRATQTRTT